MLSVDAQETELKPYTEDDILSMGVKWSYVRPDSSPEGNSTSWKLRWSPDGTMIAIVYFDNTTVILDSQTGEVIHALGASAKVIMSPDEKTSRGTGPSANTRCWGWSNEWCRSHRMQHPYSSPYHFHLFVYNLLPLGVFYNSCHRLI